MSIQSISLYSVYVCSAQRVCTKIEIDLYKHHTEDETSVN